MATPLPMANRTPPCSDDPQAGFTRRTALKALGATPVSYTHLTLPTTSRV